MDRADYKRASYAVWERMAPGWDDRHAYFEKVAWPVSERMLERLGLQPGQTVLELAAGTGALGFAAAGAVAPAGRVVVSDFSQQMVEAARRHAAELGIVNVECRVLDAEGIALPDDAVDCVLCRWGYMLMADPVQALAETHRVLRAGGRLSCAVFAAAEANPWAAVPARVLQEHGHVSPAGAGAPGILALGDADGLGRLIAGAGFAEAAIERVPFAFRFADTDDYWAFLSDVAGAIAMVIAVLDVRERDRVRAHIAELASPYMTGEGLELPAECLVATATAQ